MAKNTTKGKVLHNVTKTHIIKSEVNTNGRY